MPDPIWISHRGFCRQATENTAEAFRAAQAEGFRHLETDLRTTADGHILLAHDPDLTRIGGPALNLEAYDRHRLEGLRLRGGERLVFFDEFLPEFAQNHWILDIKPESGMRTLAELLRWWRQPEYADFFRQRVRFLFWRKDQQNYLLRHRPEAVCMARIEQCRRVGLVCLLGLPAGSVIEPGASYALPPRVKGVNLMRPGILSRYWRHHARVLAYLPETVGDTREALKAGADEILTNGAPLCS